MFKHYPKYYQTSVATKALEALNGLGLHTLTNSDNNTFWYQEDMETRFKQEEAKVGQHFWDGNNGDKHTVVAVDLENSRLAYRNEDQNEELIEIVGW